MVAGALWRGWAIAAPPCQLSRRGGHGQRGAPVWHIHEPVDRLKRLCDEWERVCIGSSAQFHVVGAQNWHLRIVLEHDGIKSELAKVIERIHARPHRPRTTFIVALPNGCQVKKWHLRLRFDSARKAAAELALKAGDEELASRIKAFQFRDIRARSASDIADLGAASSLLGHSEKVITEKVYRRIGQAVRPTR